MLELLVFPHPICVCAALRKRYIECYTIGHLDVFFVHRDEHAASTQVDDEDLQKISRWMRRASQRAHTKDCSPTSVAASVSRCARKDATRVLDQTNAPHIDSLFGNGRAPLPTRVLSSSVPKSKVGSFRRKPRHFFAKFRDFDSISKMYINKIKMYIPRARVHSRRHDVSCRPLLLCSLWIDRMFLLLHI